MRNIINEWCDLNKKLTILDIGSYDVNGNYRASIPNNWFYVGVDVAKGNNVDVVISEYQVPFKNIDLIISGSCLQYVKNPFKLIGSASKSLKKSGIMILSAPREQADGLIGLPRHLCPEKKKGFDCWRFLPDGMKALLEEANLRVLKTYYNGNDCWGIGIKND